MSEYSEQKLALFHIQLQPHPRARDQVVATTDFTEGSVIFKQHALATALLPAEKGRRCDACSRLAFDRALRRCSGCAEYYYCDEHCQRYHWQKNHKRICKLYSSFSASLGSLPEHSRMDAILLSHLLAQITPDDLTTDSSPVQTLLSLLPSPQEENPAPPVCNVPQFVPSILVQTLFVRFQNNNFAMHSHLSTFGHGIFPLASRLFNHSCVPNAAARYILRPREPVKMEVVALRPILAGEEICIPYVDPALLETRQQIFKLSYGFECRCSSCQFLSRISKNQLPSEASPDTSELEAGLRELSGVDEGSITRLRTSIVQDTIPSHLHPAFKEAFISSLSKKFTDAAHDGPYDVAQKAGAALLALYLMIYPDNYPQVGMHLLELAKVVWNDIVKNGEDRVKRRTARNYATAARGVLAVFGEEGDEGGPLSELAMLEDLLWNS
ncbi:SET domain-containing protein [Schizophyllum commune Tattone D]|nr:SET domain-containing protein [Schizophyllum commune Tattone D]